jgi:hypothetical protein
MHMKRLAVAAVALTLFAFAAHAHPSVSVVIDSHGNVYFSDLAQVWRVTTDGKQSVVVPNVHTHELYLDPQDNLYGENLWYEGDATKKWGHYFWRRTAAGRIERIMPAHEPFKNEDDVSLVRDRAGNQYWADRKNNAIMKRTPAGQKSVLARGKFNDVRWMTATPEGVIYFVDTLDLLRVMPDGKMSVYARGVSTKDLIETGPAHHQIQGLWTDRAGNVYAADNKNNVVKRIARNGTISIYVRSWLPWSINGGAFAPNGDLWLLESAVYESRVRRIDRSALPR